MTAPPEAEAKPARGADTAGPAAAIRAAIEGPILSGEWPPGTRVPAEEELAARFGCARMTVNKVLTRLAEAGLVERRRRAGTVVAAPRSEATLLEIADIRAEIAARGAAPGHTVLARRRRKASAGDARRLGIATGRLVLAIAVLHRAGAVPHALEDRLIALDTVPEVAEADFTAVPPGAWLLARVPWTAAEHRVAAVAARPEEAVRLGIAAGAACLAVERTTWRGDDVVTAVRLLYPGDRHVLVGRSGPGRRGG